MDDGSAGHRVHGGVHRRKSTKKTQKPNKKNKPIKVVYISNPMKVQTSASEFMALVQELTGQDADFPDPSKFPPAAACGGAAPVLLDHTAAGVFPDPSVAVVELQPAEDDDDLLDLGSCYDDFIDDLLFPPPVIGNFSGLLPAAAAAVMYESYAR